MTPLIEYCESSLTSAQKLNQRAIMNGVDLLVLSEAVLVIDWAYTPRQIDSSTNTVACA